MKKILSLAMVIAMLMLSVVALIPAVSAAEPASRAPRYVAYQSSEAEGGKFTLRMCAVIDDLKEHDVVGFKVTLTRVMDGKQKSATLSVQCTHAYESITVEGQKVHPAEYGGKYFVALNVTGIPAAESIGYEITPFSIKGGETEYGEKSDFSLNKGGWEAEVPAFTTSNSSYVTVNGVRQFADGTYQIAATQSSANGNTLQTDYTNYINTLKNNGYTLYAENTIDQNTYATYKGITSMVHVYYEKVYSGTPTFRVLYAPIEKMKYPLAPTSDEGVQVTTPSLTLMSLDYASQSANAANHNGMGFVYTMADGSYVILDGGWSYDTDTLFSFLKNNNRREDGKILIRAWLITHPHEDHYGNFESFATKYANQVELEYFVANLGGGASINDHPNQGDVTRVHTALAKFTSTQNTKYIVPQVGQEMYFGDVKFEFLHTQERLYPSFRMTDGNDYSLIAKVTFEGKIMLMTGDGYPQAVSSNLVAAYGEYLKADYIQTPHHGHGGSSNEFYNLVNAEFAFVNTSNANMQNRLNSSAEKGYDAPLTYLINTKFSGDTSKYWVADGGYKTIYYGEPPALIFDDYATNKDTIVFGDYFQ